MFCFVLLLDLSKDLSNDTNLCTRFRVDGIKVMSRGVSGGQASDKI